MKGPKFKVNDYIKYNGNIYRIYKITRFPCIAAVETEFYTYKVICVKNNFPDEIPATCLGMAAEDDMEIAKFEELSEKEQFIYEAVEWLSQQKEMVGVSFTEDFYERFKKHMRNYDKK